MHAAISSPSLFLSLLSHFDVPILIITFEENPDTRFHSASEACRQDLVPSPGSIWIYFLLLSMQTHIYSLIHTNTHRCQSCCQIIQI